MNPHAAPPAERSRFIAGLVMALTIGLSRSCLMSLLDLPAGNALAESDVEERRIDQALLAPSWIRTEDRPQAVGRRLLAPFRKGDPSLWTHLEAGVK